jgi:hypothetical protein
METLPTIQIVNKNAPNGFMLINESDFDASIHTKFGETAKAEPVDDGIAMTDTELRAFIGEATGTMPHYARSLAKLRAQCRITKQAAHHWLHNTRRLKPQLNSQRLAHNGINC